MRKQRPERGHSPETPSQELIVRCQSQAPDHWVFTVGTRFLAQCLPSAQAVYSMAFPPPLLPSPPLLSPEECCLN